MWVPFPGQNAERRQLVGAPLVGALPRAKRREKTIGRGAPCGRPSWAIVTSEFRCDCPGASRLNQYPLPTAPEQRKCDKIGPSQKLAQNPATSNFQTRHHMRSPQRPALSIMPVAHRQAKPLSAQDAAPPKLPPQQTVKGVPAQSSRRDFNLLLVANSPGPIETWRRLLTK